MLHAADGARRCRVARPAQSARAQCHLHVPGRARPGRSIVKRTIRRTAGILVLIAALFGSAVLFLQRKPRLEALSAFALPLLALLLAWAVCASA